MTHQSPIKWPMSNISQEDNLKFISKWANDFGMKGYQITEIHIKDGFIWYDMIHKA
jgi:hypothetical protein